MQKEKRKIQHTRLQEKIIHETSSSINQLNVLCIICIITVETFFKCILLGVSSETSFVRVTAEDGFTTHAGICSLATCRQVQNVQPVTFYSCINWPFCFRCYHHHSRFTTYYVRTTRVRRCSGCYRLDHRTHGGPFCPLIKPFKLQPYKQEVSYTPSSRLFIFYSDTDCE